MRDHLRAHLGGEKSDASAQEVLAEVRAHDERVDARGEGSVFAERERPSPCAPNDAPNDAPSFPFLSFPFVPPPRYDILHDGEEVRVRRRERAEDAHQTLRNIRRTLASVGVVQNPRVSIPSDASVRERFVGISEDTSDHVRERARRQTPPRRRVDDAARETRSRMTSSFHHHRAFSRPRPRPRPRPEAPSTVA